MKFSAVLVIACLSTASCAAAREPYPSDNTMYFRNASLDASYEGKIIAVEGQINEARTAHQSKPLLRLRLPRPVSQDIWVASLVARSGSLLQKGHIVRVLGYLSAIEPADNLLAGTGARFVVLGACILDVTEKQALYLPEAGGDCTAWESGTAAEDLR